MRGQSQRHEVVHALEVDLLALQLEVNAVEALDPSVEIDNGHLRLFQLHADRPGQLLDHTLRERPPALDLGPESLVRLRLDIPERELLKLVLDLAHPQPVRNRGIDVERLLGDRDATLLGQVVERPHVVEAVGELDEDDADVIHHGEEHLAEILGLTLLTRREGNGADLRHAFHNVRDLGAKELGDALRGSDGVLHDVVEQAGRHGHDVQLHVGERIGNLERMNQVRLARVAHLPFVFEGGKHVRPAQELQIGLRAVAPHFFQERVEANHEGRCLA